MTKMSKASKLTAIVIAIMMTVCIIAGVAAQSSVATAKVSGLAAHEQVMDDAAQTVESEALEACEQVID